MDLWSSHLIIIIWLIWPPLPAVAHHRCCDLNLWGWHQHPGRQPGASLPTSPCRMGFHEDLKCLKHLPYAPCMVYLPTFGWFLGQMLVNIPAPWSIWVLKLWLSVETCTCNKSNFRGFNGECPRRNDWTHLKTDNREWIDPTRNKSFPMGIQYVWKGIINVCIVPISCMVQCYNHLTLEAWAQTPAASLFAGIPG